MEVSGKTIVITGAGSGLGRCVALQLGRLGATIACVDYSDILLRETIALLEKQSTPCSAHFADISERDSVAKLVTEIDSLHDGFDGLINNAGIMQSFTPISELAIEDIERIMQVNFWGMVMLVKASLPILTHRSSAVIVNISSLSALMPFPGQIAYSASKAAVRIFSEGLRLELKSSGVEVILVMPGAMNTGIVENSPFHSEEDKTKLKAMSEGGALVLTPERAARKILSAIASGKHRLILGYDAWLLDKCYRLAPRTTNRLLRSAMQFLPVNRKS